MPSILSSYVAIGGAIDWLWNVFMGLHIIIFAVIYKYGNAISPSERFAFIVSYGVFSIMNYRSITFNYEMLDVTRISIITFFGKQ